jgi:hypothetical protein
MPNSQENNPIFIDEAGLVSANKVHITGISVNANADNWEVILHNSEGGVLIFDQSSSIANDRGGYFPISFIVSGIWATTLTGVDNVRVYKRAAV